MTTAAQLTRHHSASVDRLVHEKPIALRLDKQELADAHAQAKAQGRSSSNFARLIHLMGMAEFRRRGRIELPSDSMANN